MNKRTKIITLRLSKKTFKLLRSLPWGKKALAVDRLVSSQTKQALRKIAA